jgi:AcrR family transcriptional regulator
VKVPQIIASAKAVFAERGVQNTTFIQLAHHAQVSEMTIRRKFKDMDGVYRDVVADSACILAERFSSRIDANRICTPQLVIREYVASVHELFVTARTSIIMLYGHDGRLSHYSAKHQAHKQMYVDHAMLVAKLSENIDQLIAYQFVKFLGGMLTTAVQNGTNFDPESITTAAYGTLCGMANIPGAISSEVFQRRMAVLKEMSQHIEQLSALASEALS